MSKPKKPKLKVYTISETIHVCYQVVAVSEEDAQEMYRNLPNEEFQQLLADGASNNYCNDEVVNEEDYIEDEMHFNDITEKAKYVLRNKKK